MWHGSCDLICRRGTVLAQILGHKRRVGLQAAAVIVAMVALVGYLGVATLGWGFALLVTLTAFGVAFFARRPDASSLFAASNVRQLR